MSGSTTKDERRQDVGQRVQFEALVEIGEATGPGGFEAESLDVSPQGMRLRTAYLPAVGDKLICRFESPKEELVVEGTVAWCNEEARGGEFGLSFDAPDPAVAATLRELCAPVEALPPETEPSARGSRVRLHIDGLGAPMKARVRASASGEVQVGSNLEFLKVGRALEVEDVDGRSKRQAYVDEVSVEVDPSTSVPQLVVSLRYEGEPRAKAAAAAAPVKSKSVRPAAVAAPAASAVEQTEEQELSASAEEEGEDIAEESRLALVTQKLGASTSKAAKAALTGAKRLGPVLAGASTQGKDAVLGLMARLRDKRASKGEAAPAPGVRRKTAPPPGGALTSEGRRLVRDAGEAEESEPLAVAPAPSRRRSAMIGGSVGLVLLLSVFGVSRAMQSDPAPAAPAAIAELPPAPVMPGAVAVANTGLTANVPLFGDTPLTTAPAASDAAPADSALAAGDAAAEDEEAPPAALQKEWGTGEVSHPRVLRLKLDGTIAGLSGTSNPMGFTVIVPGRQAITSSNDLVRRDKRLESVDVINTPDGTEITVEFKEPIEAYSAKAKGNRLEIALGTEGGAVASKSTSSRAHGKSTAKKTTTKKSSTAKKKK